MIDFSLCKASLLYFCVFCVAIFGSCSSDNNEPDGDDNKNTAEEKMALSLKDSFYNAYFEESNEVRDATDIDYISNNFAFRLFHETNKKELLNSTCLSPVSAYMALSMLANGDNGAASKEILKALNVTDDEMSIEKLNETNASLIENLNYSDEKSCFRLVNSLWVNGYFDILNAYAEILHDVYKAYSCSLKLDSEEGKQIINNWIASNTNNQITDFFKSPLQGIECVLVNLLYFKDEWKDKFDSKMTKDILFHSILGKDINVPMMVGASMSFGYYENSEMQMVSLPYENEYEFMAILPKTEEFCKFLGGFNYSKFSNALNNKVQNVLPVITIPRFEIDSNFDLRETLSAMGVKGVFVGPGLNGINSDNSSMYVDQINQKSKISVTEKGTEGSSSTVITEFGSNQPEEYNIVKIEYDRPFVYLIRHKKSNVILFIGKVMGFV